MMGLGKEASCIYIYTVLLLEEEQVNLTVVMQGRSIVCV